MKILLIKSEILTPIETAISAPLGILYLASLAEKRGHEVRVEDLRTTQVRNIPRRLSRLADWNPDLIGLSALSTYADTFGSVARFFRKRNPRALRIGGGPYPSADPAEPLEKRWVDLCVMREAESSFPALLADLDAGGDGSRSPGVACLRDGRIQQNPPLPPIQDLDSIPFPAWHFVPFRKYRHRSAFSSTWRSHAAVLSSRGCPYQCVYCHNMFGKKFRTRSPENVLSEIELLSTKYAVRRVEFTDDVFNLDRARAAAILEGIAARFSDMKIAFPNGLRGDLLDEELVLLLRKANCYHVSVAVETGSPKMQKAIRKNLDLNKLDNTLRLLNKHELSTRLYIIIGLPGETEQDLQQTVEFRERHAFAEAFVFIASPLNDSVMRRDLDPSVLNGLDRRKSDFDYVWGTDSISEIPQQTLDRVQARLHRKPLNRAQGRLMAHRLLGILRSLLIDRNPAALYSLWIYSLGALGFKSHAVKARALALRRRWFRSLDRGLSKAASSDRDFLAPNPRMKPHPRQPECP